MKKSEIRKGRSRLEADESIPFDIGQSEVVLSAEQIRAASLEDKRSVIAMMVRSPLAQRPVSSDRISTARGGNARDRCNSVRAKRGGARSKDRSRHGRVEDGAGGLEASFRGEGARHGDVGVRYEFVGFCPGRSLRPSFLAVMVVRRFDCLEIGKVGLSGWVPPGIGGGCRCPRSFPVFEIVAVFGIVVPGCVVVERDAWVERSWLNGCLLDVLSVEQV